MLEPDIATIACYLGHEKWPDDADAVVVGTITRRQPFLTQNQKAIYTEYTLRIASVVRKTERAPRGMKDSADITILHRGGKAKLPDGREVEYRIIGEIVPEVGKEYLMFLRHDSALDAFHDITYWDVTHGTLEAVFPTAASSQWQGKRLIEAAEALRGGSAH
jgi:hypothetical protein